MKIKVEQGHLQWLAAAEREQQRASLTEGVLVTMMLGSCS
jgi:hypothetical protein